MSELISLAEFARRQNCDRSNISHAIKTGRLKRALTTRNRRRYLIADVAKEEWEQTKNPSCEETRYNGSGPKATPKNMSGNETEDLLKKDGIPPYFYSKSKKMYHEAINTEVETMKNIGQVMLREVAIDAANEFILGLKQTMDEFVFKLGNKVKQMLPEEKHKELSQYLKENKEKIYTRWDELLDENNKRGLS